MVYVLSKEGNPLMPTERNGNVRRMLRDGRAVVVRRTPFTIRLTRDTTDHIQDVTLGVDAGTAHVGLSATTEGKELFSAEVQLRTDVVKLISSRREARRTRRGRKTRYRAPRFNNRRRPGGWLAPSVRQKVESHLNLIGKVRSILPVKETVIEVAQFDMQLIRNPGISGAEYQQGPQMGFWNTREYVLYRDNHTCQRCHGKSKDPILNVHHIESRQTGGDSPSNLITLCETCHKEYHAGKVKPGIRRSPASLRDAAVMNTMRWEVYNRAKAQWNDVHLTYGYITKNTRIRAGLEKSKNTDARCISGHPLARQCEEWQQARQTRRHNRQIYKSNTLSGGRRKANQAPYLVKGFRLFDKVELNGIRCYVFGRRNSGCFDVRLLDGTKVNAGISCRKLRFIEPTKRYLCSTQKRLAAIPPTNEFVGFLAELS